MNKKLLPHLSINREIMAGAIKQPIVLTNNMVWFINTILLLSTVLQAQDMDKG